MLLIFLSILNLVIVYYLASNAAGGKIVFSPVNVYIVLFVIFHFPLLFSIDSSRGLYFAVINVGLLSFVTSAYLVSKKYNVFQKRQYSLQSSIYTIPNEVGYFMFLLAICVSLAFYRGLPPSFSIVVGALQGKNIYNELLGMSEYRSNLTKSHYFGGDYSGQGALKIFNEIIWQFVALIFFFKALSSKHWIIPGFVFLFSALFIYGVGAKGPVAYIAVCMIVLYSFIVRIKPSTFLKFTLVFLVFLLLVQSAQITRFVGKEESFFVSVAETLGRRLIAGNGLHTYYIVDLLDRGVIHFQEGREHMIRFLNSLPGVQYDVPFAHKLFWLITEGKSANKTTYASHTYIGGIYLDFGFTGIIVISAFLGFLLQSIYIYMLSVERTTYNIAFLAVLTVHLGQLATNNLITLPATLVAAFLIYYSGVVFGKVIHRR